MHLYLQSTFFVDIDHPSVREFVRKNCDPKSQIRDQAVELFYAIRDGFRYNPYRVGARPEDYKASEVAQRDFMRGGHCIDKATLLAACARAVGIPSRLHFANVRNHVGTEKLEQQLGSDVLVFHGYVELFLDEKWVACTPAFNQELCERLGVSALGFDGKQDAVFQEYDKEGNKFMEYLHDYGTFADIPYDLMMAEWKKFYPQYVDKLLRNAVSLD